MLILIKSTSTNPSFAGLQFRQGHVFLKSRFSLTTSARAANLSSSRRPDVG